MRWIEALKIWNNHHHLMNPLHVWATPRKATPEYMEVMTIKNTEGKTDHIKTFKKIDKEYDDLMAELDSALDKSAGGKPLHLKPLSALQKFATGVKY